MAVIKKRYYDTVYEIPAEIFFRILCPPNVGEDVPEGGFVYYDTETERGFYSPDCVDDQTLVNTVWDTLEINLEGLSADMFQTALRLAEMMEGEEWTQEALEIAWAAVMQRDDGTARNLPSEVTPEVEELAYYLLHKESCPFCGAVIDYLPNWENPPCGGDPSWHEEGFADVKVTVKFEH